MPFENRAQSGVPTGVGYISGACLTTFCVLSRIEVPGKVKRGNDRSCHLALWVFVMIQGFHYIVTLAKYCYKLAAHALLRLKFGLVTFNFTGFRIDLFNLLTQGSNCPENSTDFRACW